MNIAHLLPHTAKLPLTKHNGRYEWALRLARLQAAMGHTVTIYSSPESHGEGVEWRSTPNVSDDKDANNAALFTEAFSHPEHDIFHSHFDSLHYLMADKTSKPVIFTQHWFPTEKIAEASKSNKSGNVLAVPVTQYMQKNDHMLGIKTSKTIYHGIDLSLFKVNTHKSDRLIFVGRISPNKGVMEAVKIAVASNSKMDIAGKVNHTDLNYWNEILPYIDGERIRYLGPQTQEKIAELLANAKAMIFPSQATEAFGQTTIESQACGTPVIVSNIGASSELVINNVTGFVVKTMADFQSAIDNIDRIKPSDCRKFAENFDINNMVKDYDSLYRSLV